ncbi:hypothetical protein JZO66_08325 [Enterococcus sp. DIV0242_7C1]|uniref:Uncharacterized protein n=1 Tax=Candidatus Enterococcus dunnyi TaxID=1834192 RepID=A0A200J751_9ENTE|nr:MULTISPECIES: hypothetical protein [unclassified Enterococcus]MBO0470550.1 hypothetical protein [Enterococcus sp. DIV0242_7C1]OUZ32994.1 hypothetical protein A5889_001703 [Enterococcus sp. 9D6_DIV0238]
MHRKGEEKLKKGKIVLIVLVLIGCVGATIYLKSAGKKEVPKEDVKQQAESTEQEKTKPRAEYKKAPGLLTISMYEMSDEELYQRFGYPSEAGIEELFFDNKDTDKIVALKDGSILSGEMVDNDILVEVSSETDPNALTVREAKELLKSRQEALYQLYEAEITNTSE